MSGIVRLGASRGCVRLGAAQRRELRRQFASRHFIHFKELVPPRLAAAIVGELGKSRFVHFTFPNDIGSEEQARNARLLRDVSLLVWSPVFIRLLEESTDCGRIKAFASRFYRMRPGSEHHFDWHSDRADPSRLLGFSLNLSPEPFEGGRFEIRRVGGAPQGIANARLGDAIVFRISDDHRHRVTPLVGAKMKQSMAGWFRDRTELSGPES